MSILLPLFHTVSSLFFFFSIFFFFFTGCNIFENVSLKEIVQQADQNLTSEPVENMVGEKRLPNSYGQCNKEDVAVGMPAPSDALNLLADLALSVNSDKMLPKHLGAKTSSSPFPQVFHLLQSPVARFKLPDKSPFPEGLVVTGDLILEISREHSYSQPSLLSGLAGICPQVQPQVQCVESCLPMKSDLLLKLPDLANYPGFRNKEGKNGWKFLPSLPGSAVKAKVWSSLFLRCRTIVEKEGSIQVTRHWKENYDFKFDSKFTNDKLDKCVTRALHGYVLPFLLLLLLPPPPSSKNLLKSVIKVFLYFYSHVISQCVCVSM